ncbi:AAA family ATPase [Candidatus Sumerlaeota bacterium]|nr:AAA family ATPase [Candidatus Sumerlaeota bacterium]
MNNNLITLPGSSLVLLVGVSGSGKTTFARCHFLSSQILSSDRFRAMISDDENCMEVSRDAFEILYMVTRKRLSGKKLTVIDATNIQDYGRRILLDIAAECGAPVVALILNIPEDVCIDRAIKRTDRIIPLEVVFEQFKEFKRTTKAVYSENFHSVYILNGPDEVNQAIVSITDETVTRIDETSSVAAPISIHRISSVPIS